MIFWAIFGLRIPYRLFYNQNSIRKTMRLSEWNRNPNLHAQSAKICMFCHDFLVILAMSTTCLRHGRAIPIYIYGHYHTAISFEPMCSHIKPEGLTSSPLRGPTQWLVYNGPQWSRLHTTSPLRGPIRILDAPPRSRARGFGRGTMSLVAL